MSSGLRRFIPHFLGWGGGASALLFGLYALRAPYSVHWLWAWTGTTCVCLILLEIEERRAKFQDTEKTLWDLASKIGGVLTAAATAQWWWI